MLDLSSVYFKRKADGLSRKALSEKTEISEIRLAKIEKENDIYLSELLTLADFFEVHESELYKRL